MIKGADEALTMVKKRGDLAVDMIAAGGLDRSAVDDKPAASDRETRARVTRMPAFIAAEDINLVYLPIILTNIVYH